MRLREHVLVVRGLRHRARRLHRLDQPAQRPRVVELGDHPAAGADDARHLVQRALDIGDVREHLERVRDVDRGGGERQRGRGGLHDVEAAIVEPLDVDGTVVTISALSMGNPHAVQVVVDVDTAPVETLGPRIERAL